MTYSSEVLADSPLVYWRLGDTGAGTTMADSSGNNRTGTYSGSGVTKGVAGLQSSDADTAVTFSGSQSGTTIAQAAWMDVAQLTVEAIIKTTSTGTRSIVDRDFNGGRVFQLRLDNGAVTFVKTVGTIVGVGTSGVSVNDGNPHHIAATYDGTTIKIYVDGVLRGSGSASGSMSGSSPMCVGVAFAGLSSSNNQPFVGTIDEVAYYGAALSATRISAHVAAMAAPPLTYTGSASFDVSADASLNVSGGAVSAGTAAASFDVSATSDLAEILATVTTNRAGGRIRQGRAAVSWEPAVVEPPAGLGMPELVDVAIAISDLNAGGAAEPYQPHFTVTTASAARQRHRILIDGRDITFFRGTLTPAPQYQLVAPLLYGPATIELPQVRPAFERLGVGALSWCRKGAPVIVQRVDVETGAVVATDYKGLVIAPDIDGDTLRLEVGGEATGRASMMNKQLPLYIRTMDLGWLAYHAIVDLRLPFDPFMGPTTGIRSDYFGGMSHLDYIHELCARAQDAAGQWSIMPGADGAYRMARKDTTTIHATAYLDDARIVGDLRSDLAEEPNRIYATAVAPDGRRIRGAVYPGLVQGPPPPYPMADGSVMTPGTTDAMTSTGDGISVMISRLTMLRYLAERDVPGGWDADVSAAIRALRRDAGRADTPNMNTTVWKDLFDLTATGYDVTGSQILPMAEQSRVRPWNRTPSGALRSRNPDYDPSVPFVDLNVDMGTGIDVNRVRQWSAAELAISQTSNWVGSIKITTGAVIAGHHVPGTPLTSASVMPVKALRPGMNLWLPLFDGGTLVHISAVTISSDGTADLLVDTRARDALKVWQIVQRNRETRHNLARRWLAEHRASTMQKDSIIEWDAVGGTVPRITLPGNAWTVFPVVAGQEGSVRRLKLNLDNANAEYAVAIFGQRIGPRRLRQLVGNPLSSSGKAKWSQESVRSQLDEDYILLYAAGDNDQPCGYYPKSKGDDGAVLNGRWQDDAGFSYHTFKQPVLWVAIWPDRNTHLRAGRIMWNQLEAGA